jgi:hypothetical protein
LTALLLAPWLLSAALADDTPTCDAVGPVPPGAMSVAWISPAGAHVGLSGKLTVVPTRALRAWLEDHGASLARLLQGMGLRRRDDEPKKAWKITIFDVDAPSLCRPIDDVPGTAVGGVPICEHGDRGVVGHDTGCGYTLDLDSGSHGLDIFQIDWSVAAARGFCVLPAERFLESR